VHLTHSRKYIKNGIFAERFFVPELYDLASPKEKEPAEKTRFFLSNSKNYFN
jgi:hypothetical protein